MRLTGNRGQTTIIPKLATVYDPPYPHPRLAEECRQALDIGPAYVTQGSSGHPTGNR